AITKMSHLHFTSTETYRNRVIQLGERPEHVFNVGSLGVENLKDLNLITKNEIENRLGFKFAAHPIMVTFHPATLEYEQSEKQFECLFVPLIVFKISKSSSLNQMQMPAAESSTG
ncbi:MAG TPA: UDP-N-acetylglucosamine 2-epimerase, partial [Desulfobacterales bacterium]|nr:UDP-N-acetylglucosamine 2-epimerase [Desulfobacterales bacterium]